MSSKKKQLIEESEKLMEMGQDDEHKAAQAVKEVQKEEEKKEKKKEDDITEKLTHDRKFVRTYKETLFRYMQSVMTEFELPFGYTWQGYATSKGLALYFQDSKKRVFGKGVKVTGEVEADKGGVQRLVLSALDFIDELEKNKEDVGGVYYGK